MPPFVPSPGVAEVRLLSLQDGRVVSNDIYAYRPPSEVNHTTLQNLSFYVGLWYRLKIVQRFSNDVFFYAHIATHLNVPDGEHVTLSTWGGFSGREGAAEPNNVALRVNFTTTMIGRSGQGCNYIPGLLKNDVSGSFVTEDTRSEYEARYNDLFGYMATSGWQWVVLSRETDGAVRTSGLATPVVAAVIPHRKVADMGRRLKGVYTPVP